MAPIVFGKIYSWSLENIRSSENKDALGFPFDQTFSFYLISITCIVTAALVTFLKRDKTEKEAKKKRLQK